MHLRTRRGSSLPETARTRQFIVRLKLASLRSLRWSKRNESAGTGSWRTSDARYLGRLDRSRRTGEFPDRPPEAIPDSRLAEKILAGPFAVPSPSTYRPQVERLGAGLYRIARSCRKVLRRREPQVEMVLRPHPLHGALLGTDREAEVASVVCPDASLPVSEVPRTQKIPPVKKKAVVIFVAGVVVGISPLLIFWYQAWRDGDLAGGL